MSPQEVKKDVSNVSTDVQTRPDVKQDIQEQLKKESEVSVAQKSIKFQDSVKAFKLSDIIIPIFSLITLVLLTIFVYIPMINQSLDNTREIKEVDAKIVKLDRLNQDLDKMDIPLLQQDLSVSRSVIPFSLQVSDFIAQVDNLARSKNLVFKDVVAGDIQVRFLGDQKTEDPVIKGVSGPLKYNGTLANITNFLDGLRNTSTFLTSTDQVVLRKGSDAASTWEVSLMVTGYYIDKNNLPQPDIYSPFQSYTQYSSIMDLFKKKVDSSTVKP